MQLITSFVHFQFSLQLRTVVNIVINKGKHVAGDVPISFIQRVFRKQFPGEFERRVAQKIREKHPYARATYRRTITTGYAEAWTVLFNDPRTCRTYVTQMPTKDEAAAKLYRYLEFEEPSQTDHEFDPVRLLLKEFKHVRLLYKIDERGKHNVLVEHQICGWRIAEDTKLAAISSMVEFLGHQFAADFAKICPIDLSNAENLSWRTLVNTARMLCKSKVLLKQVQSEQLGGEHCLDELPSKRGEFTWRVEVRNELEGTLMLVEDPCMIRAIEVASNKMMRDARKLSASLIKQWDC